MLVTKHAIDYQSAPYGRIIVIPAGVPVLPASNLPCRGEDPQYWVQAWEDMPNSARSWMNNYGFLVGAEDVEDFNRQFEEWKGDSDGSVGLD